MIIPRDFYLNRLIAGRHNHLIKIVTGIRRSGKSFLLFNLFRDWLIADGVAPDHIVAIAFDDYRNAALRDPAALLRYVESQMTDTAMYYFLLDEVQLLGEFAAVLNSFLHIANADVYVTGSNSRFLSKDVATEFRGRGVETHLYPLTFSELYSAVGGSRDAVWRDYYTYGGLPQLLAFDTREQKAVYLRGLFETVYLRDVIERGRIKYADEFGELLRVMASGIGSYSNPTRLANTFKSAKNISLDPKTISGYLALMEDAFLVERTLRYDIKGRKYINTQSKYYFQDLGLRNALIDFRQLEENHIMENVIYNELRVRGFLVDVGMVEVRSSNVRRQLEVDFVANKADTRYYIQSAFAIPDREKMEQEAASLKAIADKFRRVIIVRSDIAPYYDTNGFLIISLMDFLLDPLSLELTDRQLPTGAGAGPAFRARNHG